jgi:hypothetical protein
VDCFPLGSRSGMLFIPATFSDDCVLSVADSLWQYQNDVTSFLVCDVVTHFCCVVHICSPLVWDTYTVTTQIASHIVR